MADLGRLLWLGGGQQLGTMILSPTLHSSLSNSFPNCCSDYQHFARCLYIPSLNLGNQLVQPCHWQLECPGGDTTVSFTWFSTESNWDFVNLFSPGNEAAASTSTGNTGSTGDLGHFSGPDLQLDDVEGATLVQYITDGSVLRSPQGFTATLTCGSGLIDLQSGVGHDW